MDTSSSVRGVKRAASTEKEFSSKQKLNMDGNKPEMQDSQAITSVKKNQKRSHLDDDYSPLSGIKPYYSHVIVPSNLQPFSVVIAVSLKQHLPSKTVPLTVTCRGKTWDLIYHGERRSVAFNGWKNFAVENDLKVGDALFWEFTESTKEKVHVKVQIIKGECCGDCRPSETELLENEGGDGLNALITID